MNDFRQWFLFAKRSRSLVLSQMCLHTKWLPPSNMRKKSMLRIQLIRSTVHVDSNGCFSASSERWNSLKLHRSVGPLEHKIHKKQRMLELRKSLVCCWLEGRLHRLKTCGTGTLSRGLLCGRLIRLSISAVQREFLLKMPSSLSLPSAPIST